GLSLLQPYKVQQLVIERAVQAVTIISKFFSQKMVRPEQLIEANDLSTNRSIVRSGHIRREMNIRGFEFRITRLYEWKRDLFVEEAGSSVGFFTALPSVEFFTKVDVALKCTFKHSRIKDEHLMFGADY